MSCSLCSFFVGEKVIVQGGAADVPIS